MGAVAAVALGTYVAGVSAGLLAVFYSCARCQQDNAYLGLSSLELLLIPLSGMLIAGGSLYALNRKWWVVPVVVVAVGVVWFIVLDQLRYPLATTVGEVVLVAGGAAASYWLGGWRAMVTALGAALLIFLLTSMRGPREWAVGIGVDLLVALAAVVLGFGVAWVSRRSPRPRRAGELEPYRP